MVLLSGVLRNSPTEGKLQALEGWVLLLKALAQHAPSHLKEMANQVSCWTTFDSHMAAATSLKAR